MQKIITFIIVLVCTSLINAQNSANEEAAIKQTIETFFDGLHKGDSAIVHSTLHKNLKLQTTYTNQKGEKVLRTETKEELLINIASKKPENTYFEKLLSWNIHIDGNLASVWTPYEFYLNDNFSHCGANSFQLFNNNGKWEIIYLVDMRRRGSCKAIKK